MITTASTSTPSFHVHDQLAASLLQGATDQVASPVRSIRSIGAVAGVKVSIGANRVPDAAPMYDRTGLAHPVGALDLTTLHQQLLTQIQSRFPDIRDAAKHAIEARLKHDYRMSVDADRTYLNVFEKPIKNQCSADGGGIGRAFNGHPQVSRSLTDLQLYAASKQSSALLETPPQRLGVYSEGAWANRFDARNEVPLAPEKLFAAIRGNDFVHAYRDKLTAFWSENYNGLVVAAETEMMAYAETHRRADARARAVGLDEAVVRRLSLSDQALDMLGEAIGNADPDRKPLATQTYAFDINGYPSRDMAWLQAKNGHVVLIMPGNERHIREYANLAAMRADIQKMTTTPHGRWELTKHFTAANLNNGVTYQGVSAWLRDLSRGGYNERINYYRADYDGDLVRHIGTPDKTLLSDKAIGMVAHAAGYPDEGLGGHGTKAYTFNIDGWPSSDMTYLQATDGRTVLVIPGSRQPLREYRNLTDMRTDLRHMVEASAGRESLGDHFSIYNQRDGKTYQGVEQWLKDIRDGGYDERVAYKAKEISSPIFREQMWRLRDAEIEKLRYLAQGSANSDAELDKWIQSFGTANELLARLRDGRSLLDALSGGAFKGIGGAQRDKRAMGWIPQADACNPGLDNSRRHFLQTWRESLCMRAQGMLLNQARVQHQYTEPPVRFELEEPAHLVLPRPCDELELAPLDTLNAFGFLEGRHINTLYMMQRFIPDPSDPAARDASSRILHRQTADWRIANAIDVNDNAVEAYLSAEAAVRSRLPEADGYYRLLRIDSSGMRTVSFGNNRRNNQDYERLVDDQLRPILAPFPLGVRRLLVEQFEIEQEDLVHLSLEGQRPDIAVVERIIQIEAGRRVASATPPEQRGL